MLVYNYEQIYESRELVDADDIHIWLISLVNKNEQMSLFENILSAEEKLKIKLMHNEDRKTQYIYCRVALRTIISNYLDILPQEINIVCGRSGKPTLSLINNKKNIYFNMAHSKNLAICALSKKRFVGVDMEYIYSKLDILAIAKFFFSSKEYALLNTFKPERQQEIFFKMWTLKEAFAKASAEGLIGITKVELSLVTDMTENFLINNVNSSPNMNVHQFKPKPGYVAAIVSYD
jgi:4'-phosphopantetheinyl transferase